MEDKWVDILWNWSASLTYNCRLSLFKYNYPLSNNKIPILTEMIPTRKLIETTNDDARFYRRRSDAQFGRKFSDGNILCFNSNLKKRTSSFSDYPRRLSVKSDQDFRKFSSGSIDVFYQSRRYSRDDVMEAHGFTKSKVYPITERKILENVDGLYLSKSKLMKTRSTNNIFLPPLNLRLPKTSRKPQKPNGKSLRRVRSENYVIPLPFKNKILVSCFFSKKKYELWQSK